MATFTSSFERKESKYRLSAQQLRTMIPLVEERLALDAFGRTRVTSLYFDTPDRALIARSIEKPFYKEKLRVRWYDGEPDANGVASRRSADGDRVFVEIKKKCDGIVYKRRVACSRAAARAYLVGGVPYENACRHFPLADELQQAESLSSTNVQIAKEIDAFCEAHGPLGPSMLVMCERLAYAPTPSTEGEGGVRSACPLGDVGGASRQEAAGNLTSAEAVAEAARRVFVRNAGLPGRFGDPSGSSRSPLDGGSFLSGASASESDLRITFDTGISYRDEMARRRGGFASCAPLLPLGEAIMEVKTSQPYPMWLVDALSGISAYPSSFSKYGAAYEACGRPRKRVAVPTSGRSAAARRFSAPQPLRAHRETLALKRMLKKENRCA